MLRGLSLAVAGALVVVAACSSFTAEEDPPGQAEAGAVDSSSTEASTTDASTAADAADAGHLTTGCADGTREELFYAPTIAACEGAWGRGGIRADGVAMCNRMGGNDGPLASACGAEDLCAPRWHLCKDHADVSIHGGAGAGPCAMEEGGSGVFYATAQATAGLNDCLAGDTENTNDVVGCGSFARPNASCSPLNAVITSYVHPDNFFFAAGDNNERTTATHGSGAGGVLCCTDD